MLKTLSAGHVVWLEACDWLGAGHVIWLEACDWCWCPSATVSRLSNCTTDATKVVADSETERWKVLRKSLVLPDVETTRLSSSLQTSVPRGVLLRSRLNEGTSIRES